MPIHVRAQHIYYDKKSRRRSYQKPKPKGKLASYVVANVYGFFELTSKDYVIEHHRVDIQRSDLENLTKGLASNTGCIKIIDLEPLSEAELLRKINDRRNGFPEIARLCDEKWHEVQEKARSSRLRQGKRPMSVEKQKDLIKYTHDPNEVDDILKDLRFI